VRGSIREDGESWICGDSPSPGSLTRSDLSLQGGEVKFTGRYFFAFAAFFAGFSFAGFFSAFTATGVLAAIRIDRA
jgi:hypothetical protein